MTETSPTAQRREVGTLLRAHRERAGLTAAEVAVRVGISAAKLSRLERGLRGLQIGDVRALCELYRLTEYETRDLLSSTRASREPGWWSGYAELDSAAPMLYGLESAARVIANFQALCVPGLLQTEEYAIALVSRLRPEGAFAPEAVNDRVGARMRRKRLLALEHGKSFHFVIDEAALRRRVGTPEVMAQQVSAIGQYSSAPNVRVQLIPFSVGAHPGIDGSFTIQGFGQEALQDVVFVEGLAGTLLIDSSVQVDMYKRVLADLAGSALSEKETQRVLREVESDWRGTS